MTMQAQEEHFSVCLQEGVTAFPMELQAASAGGYKLPAATRDTLGGIRVGENLNICDGVLSVDAADTVADHDTRPVCGAAVYTLLGDVEAPLAALSEGTT